MRTIQVDLSIPQTHACYNAHFPGNPIVPGALLLQWIVTHANAHFEGTIHGVKSMKFCALARPGDRCTIEFNLAGTNMLSNMDTIKVCCLRDTEVICKGILLLAKESMGVY